MTFYLDVNVHSKRNKQKKFVKLFFVVILKVSDENSRIRIHIKMSWIRNTALEKNFLFDKGSYMPPCMHEKNFEVFSQEVTKSNTLKFSFF